MSNLSIISQPPKIALIEDGLNFKIKSGYETYAQAAELIVDFPDSSGDYLNKYFKLANGNDTLEFYFRTNPDQSGLELRDWESNDYDQFIQNLLEDLNSNLFILTNYILSISINGTVKGIHFTARESGGKWNLNISETNITGVNGSFINYGTDSIIPADYAIYMATCLSSDGDEAKPLGEDLMNIDENQEISNNIAAYLKNQIKTSFSFPFAWTNIITVADAVKQYYIRYAEYQNASFQKLFNTFSTALYAVAGGLKQIDRKLLEGLGGDYFSFGYNAKRFLTWAPQTKETFNGTTEKLYFLVQNSGLKVMKKAIYADSEVVSKIADISVPEMNVIEIFCGTYEIFTETERKNLLQYEIWIADANNNQVSEIRTFTINTSYFQNIRTLIFKNSLGMYDCIHCTGIQTIYDNVKRTIINVLEKDIFRKKVSLTENNSLFSLNTGWLPEKESRLWLEDLQLSKDVFLIMGDVLLPVIMNTAKLLRTEDGNDLYSLQIDFEPDYNETRYSALTGEGINFVKDADYKIFTDENGVPYIY